MISTGNDQWKATTCKTTGTPAYTWLLLIWVLALATPVQTALCQPVMMNIEGRHTTTLNGEWKILVDAAGTGDWLRVWEERRPRAKTDFVEYAFDNAPTLHVPGDFNTQRPDLTYYEGTVWYQHSFNYHLPAGHRLFLHFGAVNYRADVYLNGRLLGSHEGGFTPFQFELANVQEGKNSLVVRVNNDRVKNGIPGASYDWFNYGGITRDVQLVETPGTYIKDYSLELDKQSGKEVRGWVKLDGAGAANETIKVSIPQLHLSCTTRTNNNGLAPVHFSRVPALWSPESPVLHQVVFSSPADTVADRIGFRRIEVSGSDILLNGKKLFLKGVNIHEERPVHGGRAYTAADARTLLTWAKELGCNLVRLAHYPHNEHMVKIAEEMGLIVWDELPVYQHIVFSDSLVKQKMDLMLQEMIQRDKNRCAVFIWSLANETYPSTPGRDEVLLRFIKQCRSLDSSRLITLVTSSQEYRNNTFRIPDSLFSYADIVAMNEYIGWYIPWQGKPEEVKWQTGFSKPLIISEFGAEAKFGNNAADGDIADNWTEAYQEQVYKKQVSMFRHTPGLAGVCAWILADYRSPGRMRPGLQDGYNRKGLLSERGEKKKAWYVLKNFYDTGMQ
jgi:beta-glucuronidase